MNRVHHLGVVGLIATVGLLLAPAVQVGLTTAATGTSGAGSSEALQGKVRILCKGTATGPQFAASGRGRFTLTGAISDRGRFVDGDFQGVHPESDPHVRTLFGARGTIRIIVYGTAGATGRWRITKGTKAYAGLRGRGRETGAYFSKSTIDITMSGTVPQ